MSSSWPGPHLCVLHTTRSERKPQVRGGTGDQSKERGRFYLSPLLNACQAYAPARSWFRRHAAPRSAGDNKGPTATDKREPTRAAMNEVPVKVRSVTGRVCHRRHVLVPYGRSLALSSGRSAGIAIRVVGTSRRYSTCPLANLGQTSGTSYGVDTSYASPF